MNRNMWLTLLASVGVGAAAYYTMSKSNTPITQAMQNVAPMLSNMNNSSDGNTDSGQFGPHGMS